MPQAHEPEPIVEALAGTPIARRRVEIVERKGIGHPDTICDAVAEAIAVELARMYVARTGTVAHFNVDKALLLAGECTKQFGDGRMVRPMELIVGDRATFELDGHRLPVEDTVQAAVDGWLRAHLRGVRPGADLQVRCALAPGSVELTGILRRPGAVVANDTSGASGYAPRTATEETVLAVERFLNSPEFKREFPDTGEDVKVFGRREDERLDLTVAMPLSCRAIDSERAYFRRKEEVLHALTTRFREVPLDLAWRLNALDRPGHGLEGVYLTLTGTSAEDADSGQVGRGNRVGGVIAFARPSAAEAAAGKNPLAHPGKIYSVLSHRLAWAIHGRCPDLLEVYVHLAVRIGDPVDGPLVAVQVLPPPHVALDDLAPAVRAVVAAELACLPALKGELQRGEHVVY